MLRPKNHLHTDFIYPLLLLGVTILYIYLFWNLPLSEDSGYYAFLSKEMLHGMVLHNETPAMTNSLLLYITSSLFKIFGTTTLTFRMIHAAGYVLLTLSIYALIKKQRSAGEAFAGSLVCAIVIMLPHIMLDLGRNQIIWSLTLIILGMHVKFNYHKNFWFGFCLAIAALMRETFLIVLAAFAAVQLIQVMVESSNRRQHLHEFFIAMCGAAIGLSINAAILTYNHSWSAYLNDMLHSGVSFRYHHTFAIKHLLKNLRQFSIGFHTYYQPLVWFALMSYFFTAPKSSIINWIKYLLVPIFFIEAIVVNRTQSYSVAPLIVACSILSAYFWAELIKRSYTASPEEKRARYACCALIVIVTLATVPTYVINIFNAYYETGLINYKRINESHWTTERINYFIVHLPVTSQISSNAMYPTLFELPSVIEYHYPYTYDLSAPANLARPIIGIDQKANIMEQGPDVVILKAMAETNYYTPINELPPYPLNDHYLIIANFDPSEAFIMTTYKNRILISRRYFNAHYQATNTPINQHYANGMQITNNETQAIIAHVTTSPAACIKNLQLKNSLSQVTYDKHDNVKLELYSIVLPKCSLTIEQTHTCQTAARPEIKIGLYKRRS
jgi:hypothetical protein